MENVYDYNQEEVKAMNKTTRDNETSGGNGDGSNITNFRLDKLEAQMVNLDGRMIKLEGRMDNSDGQFRWSNG
jgi:hypothetical protein